MEQSKMKRGIPVLLAAALSLCCGTAACAAPEPQGPPAQVQISTEPEVGMGISIPQTGWTEAVPAAYKAPSAHPGTVERLDYATKDYAGDGGDIVKTAYVYLPYGYDEADTEKRYDIVYLMHGWGGSAGEYFHETQKNMFDNLMEKGDMKPAILISATFYHEDSDRDFSASIQQFRAFHEDFENALMPAVEGKYHTYAKYHHLRRCRYRRTGNDACLLQGLC